ncbi:retropepsin-like domain-containing protein [Kribbella sp. NBC_00709]|uniref:retropepsin-like aspartic protease n=1 Tax=Kribbella sp. NBC_00709 TaxID=2975972 RepID=UPI002E27E4AC|nr:retropepsin-like aspartic protease [Kribbella sp. NBC_00709]
MTSIGFDRLQHLVRVRVTTGGRDWPFLVDTGIGITVISSAIADHLDPAMTGETFSGRRMSGQVVETPLVRVPRMELGDHVVDGHVAGMVDLGDPNDPNAFAGILGPTFFEGQVVTTDPDAMTLTVQPRETFVADGPEIPLEVRREPVSADPFARLVLPNGREISVEVDTGSDSLILDTRFAVDCGVDLDGPDVLTRTGTDETGYAWTRHWVTVAGSVHLAAAPETAQASPRAQFQNIIHDGLVGTGYLDRYRMSFDITGSRLVLGERRALR